MSGDERPETGRSGSLFAGARRLDEVKWLISREIPRLRRYALALTDDPESADDLVQDCLERAIVKRHQWTRQGSIRGWLFRILQRRFYDMCSRRGRRRDVPFADGADELAIDGRQESHMALADIRLAMQRLPDDHRAVIALTALEGLSYDEVAEILDIPIGTVRSRLARGRESLRRLYEGQQEDRPASHLRRVK